MAHAKKCVIFGAVFLLCLVVLPQFAVAQDVPEEDEGAESAPSEHTVKLFACAEVVKKRLTDAEKFVQEAIKESSLPRETALNKVVAEMLHKCHSTIPAAVAGSVLQGTLDASVDLAPLTEFSKDLGTGALTPEEESLLNELTESYQQQQKETERGVGIAGFNLSELDPRLNFVYVLLVVGAFFGLTTLGIKKLMEEKTKEKRSSKKSQRLAEKRERKSGSKPKAQ
eukprot:GILK01000567.1.p1 GENE.GILK01000567.1~~GILK01000567.1.p1  ORF type:complete len:240 (+),score=46.89 GILK01000567.1:43-720(+)